MSVNDLRVGEYSRVRKLSDEDREQIRVKHGQGMTYKDIATEYNVTYYAIYFVINPEKRYKKVWKKDTERQSAYMRSHREYKRQLKKEGKI